MMIITKPWHMKRVMKGAGIFDSLARFLMRAFTSNAAKSVGKMALEAGKSAVVDASKKLITKSLETGAKKLTSRKQPNRDLVKKAERVFSKLEGSGQAVAIQDLVKRLNGSS